MHIATSCAFGYAYSHIRQRILPCMGIPICIQPHTETHFDMCGHSDMHTTTYANADRHELRTRICIPPHTETHFAMCGHSDMHAPTHGYTYCYECAHSHAYDNISKFISLHGHPDISTCTRNCTPPCARSPAERCRGRAGAAAASPASIRCAFTRAPRTRAAAFSWRTSTHQISHVEPNGKRPSVSTRTHLAQHALRVDEVVEHVEHGLDSHASARLLWTHR